MTADSLTYAADLAERTYGVAESAIAHANAGRKSDAERLMCDVAGMLRAMKAELKSLRESERKAGQ